MTSNSHNKGSPHVECRARTSILGFAGLLVCRFWPSPSGAPQLCCGCPSEKLAPKVSAQGYTLRDQGSEGPRMVVQTLAMPG